MCFQFTRRGWGVLPTVSSPPTYTCLGNTFFPWPASPVLPHDSYSWESSDCLGFTASLPTLDFSLLKLFFSFFFLLAQRQRT